jgi:hypothetical protein
MSDGNFVAVGLLTRRVLDVWGSGFRRAYPPNHTADFDFLLKRIDSTDRTQRRQLA